MAIVVRVQENIAFTLSACGVAQNILFALKYRMENLMKYYPFLSVHNKLCVQESHSPTMKSD